MAAIVLVAWAPKATAERVEVALSEPLFETNWLETGATPEDEPELSGLTSLESGLDEAASLDAAVDGQPSPQPVLSLGESAPEGGTEVATEAAPAAVAVSLGALETSEANTSTSALDLGQVSSVTEFSDVLPTDWAFQALSNLVERYGCLEGYPNQTFRGTQALSRYEFAAGLSACLDVVASLLGTEQVSAEDFEALQSLQAEFAVELDELASQVDALEAAADELEATQFATQTKLRGVVFSHLGGGFSNGSIQAEGVNVFAVGPDRTLVRTIDEEPSLTFGNLAWINMDTSFTGEDRLNLQMVFGNGTAPANFYASAGLFNTFGTPFTFQSGGLNPNDLAIRELSYTFPVGDRITLDIGPRINWYRYFDNNRYTFLITGANSFNSSGGTQVNAVDRGAGAIAVWDVTDWLDLRVGFLAENTEFLPFNTAADTTKGLFGGTNTLTAQVGIQPFDSFNLRLLYTRSNLEARGGLIGGAVSEPIYGFADDGPGGAAVGGLANSPADTFLINFDWTPTSWLGLFGRYSYGSTHLRQAGTGNKLGDLEAQSFQIGVAFPDLFKEGSLATVSYLVPFDVTGGGDFLASGLGDGGTQQEIEVSYRYPLTRNIAIVPSFYWIMNANNFSSNPDIYLLNLQTQLFF
ncbi:porin [filamentous cyanobacterium CCP5]|nr:porin [filamentous cyanobacterium CCP5]